MNRFQLSQLRTHARALLPVSGTTGAMAALAPLVEAMAQAIHASTSTYLDREHFDDDQRQLGEILARWRNARARWLAQGRTGISPGRMVLEELVSDHLTVNAEDETAAILEAEVFGARAHQLLRRTSVAVFGGETQADVVAHSLVERVHQLRHDDWIDEFRSALAGRTTELVYLPNWDGECVDSMIYELGLKASGWKQSLYADEIQPCEALARFLRWINIGTDDLLAAVRESRPAEYGTLVSHLGAFHVERDTSRPSLVSPTQAIEIMENAVHNCVPIYHCEVDLGALLDLDPNLPMAMATAKGKIHIGLHDVVNGCGYLDTYDGAVVIPEDHLGFGWVGRWAWGVDKVYGLVKSVVRVTPQTLLSEPQEQPA